METPVGGHYLEEHFHDASAHGVLWALLNKMLHIIVFGYTLYGMIQFKVKFIRAFKLVRWISYLAIAHNWYLSLKFALIALVMYMFNEKLESMGSISLADYNCSFDNHQKVFDESAKRLRILKLVIEVQQHSNGSQTNETNYLLSNLSNKLVLNNGQESMINWLDFYLKQLTNMNYPLLYARFLDTFGGPFRLLGNRATLMYGFYAIAIYIMLAIFPIELMYCNVGFNFIRFVLSDASCMRDFYRNRERHLDRLTSWSRNQTNSELTLGTKMTLNQRDLRSRYADDCDHLAAKLVVANIEQLATSSASKLRGSDAPALVRKCRCEIGTRTTSIESDSSDFSSICEENNSANKCINWSNLTLSKMATASYKLSANIKPLRSRLSINHMDAPSYQVRVANKNLSKFKPFVRSESWFKLSMIIYPIFTAYHFWLLTAVIGTISIYFSSTLSDVSESCARQLNDSSMNLWANWTFSDNLIYLETQYTVFALSCASSFYCSYYFSTIMELCVWRNELEQQLALSRILVELSNYSQHNIGLLGSLLPSSSEQFDTSRSIQAKTARQLCRSVIRNALVRKRQNELNASGSKNATKVSSSSPLFYYNENDNAELNRMVEECFNDFGGIKSYWANLKLLHSSSQSRCFKALELMAIKLLQKKQTLLRATYINMNLFFDELNETHFMTKTILRRTTQIAFGFALMASITRSQFKANYWQLTFLLAACLAILNLYLACAAIINSSVNKLLVQVHSLICATLKASSEDADLFEFWVRHIRSFGEDRDVMSYKIYGYKITWASIMNFDSVMCSAYFYTIY